ncbi:MAG: peptidoglycan DD-metalloendopeptidase family protein [Rhodoferax sp.]
MQAWARAVQRRIHAQPHQFTALVAALLLVGTGATFAVAELGPDAATALPTRTVVEALQQPDLATQIEQMAQASQALYRSELSRSSDSAASLLRRLGVVDETAIQFLRNDRLVQQQLLGRGGRSVSAETDAHGQLLRLVARWGTSEDGSFKRLSVERKGSGWQSRLESAPLVASTRMASGSIQSSLFAATDQARLPDSVAVQMADIFAGDIDFHRALRKGDRFSVVYETLEGDGEPLRAGRILSAEFVNNGKAYQAMWFTPQAQAGSAPARGGYYTLAGESLRRAYLASPMEFSRVTSGFKMRFHPILQKWKAHLGVDYAATTGTPVRSVGDGVVEFAGVQNGFGNVIMVKHGSNHTTVYAHLSRIGVRKGQSVSQGQTIGAVGSTGWATGPHLHFEFRVNGQHRDPLTIARQSEAIPLPAHARTAFASAASEARVLLGAASLADAGNGAQ